jgi:hypothetical protein
VTTTILEFAISLILFYLLLSGLCSALQELLSNALRWRGKQLETALGKLLRDTASTGKIFGHPVLAGLKSPRWLIWAESNPSYIPTESFARALLDLHGSGALPEATNKVVDTLIKGEANFDKQRAAVEKWFDDSMNRVSGWYKRKAHAWLWGIALVVCLLVNADSLRLAQIFWNDEPLRQSLVAAATTTVKEGGKSTGQDAGDQAFENVMKASKKLEATTIPLGWCNVECWPLGGSEQQNDPRHWPGGWKESLWKLLASLPGVLITALAVSQGSAFWFDLLQKAVNLRLAGDKTGAGKK